MKSKEDGTIKRGHKPLIQVHGEGPNWILIAGGALISTLVVRLGFRLNHFLQNKNSNDNTCSTKEVERTAGRMTSGMLHSDFCCCSRGSNFYPCSSDIGMSPPIKTMSHEAERSLPLVTIQQAEESNKEVNHGVMWSTSPDRLGLPHRPFHPSISSESLSESGSDVYVKREVIHRLRQQLQRRDEMIMEMQSQILELKNSLSVQMANSSNLEAQIDAANRDLFASEREIQRLRKVIADHCAGPVTGHVNGNGYGYGFEEMGPRDEVKVEMLKKEIAELKEVLEGKNFLLQSYKEEKAELCTKIKELQLRLASQVPNIL